jgi:cytoskeletal protein RodZ
MLREYGLDLKKLRELKGISISEISAQTRINPKFITNIESGIFDFQPEAYVRSFIKEYAKAIEENENHILNDYDKAKAGFYARRKFVTGEGKEISIPDEKIVPVVNEFADEPLYSKSIDGDKPDYFKQEDSPQKKGFAHWSLVRKILMGVVIIGVLAGIYFLVIYLNSSSEKKSDVKPKTFKEMSSEYENKITDKKDSQTVSTQKVASDSLKLLVKAVKDIKIKVYLDENKAVEEDMLEKDTLVLMAKEQFRFSASSSSNVELYLNGKYLRKPATLTGTSIKNLVIKKDGIVGQ